VVVCMASGSVYNMKKAGCSVRVRNTTRSGDTRATSTTGNQKVHLDAFEKNGSGNRQQGLKGGRCGVRCDEVECKPEEATMLGEW
jgi:hypothetical protein